MSKPPCAKLKPSGNSTVSSTISKPRATSSKHFCRKRLRRLRASPSPAGTSPPTTLAATFTTGIRCLTDGLLLFWPMLPATASVRRCWPPRAARTRGLASEPVKIYRRRSHKSTRRSPVIWILAGSSPSRESRALPELVIWKYYPRGMAPSCSTPLRTTLSSRSNRRECHWESCRSMSLDLPRKYS